jgi:hypothetical protein
MRLSSIILSLIFYIIRTKLLTIVKEDNISISSFNISGKEHL